MELVWSYHCATIYFGAIDPNGLFSNMLKQGTHPKIVQERLGHATISTTLDLYSHVIPGIQQAAAEGFGKLLPTCTKKQ